MTLRAPHESEAGPAERSPAFHLRRSQAIPSAVPARPRPGTRAGQFDFALGVPREQANCAELDVSFALSQPMRSLAACSACASLSNDAMTACSGLLSAMCLLLWRTDHATLPPLCSARAERRITPEPVKPG